MTANADTGATRADTTDTRTTGTGTTGTGTTGTTGHTAADDTTASHSAASHSGSRAGIDGDDRSWTPPTNTDVRQDRIRWGAVWTGVLTTLSIYIVLQLLFFALGWLDLGINGADGTTRAIVSGVLALIAFFLGGAAAGASALWRRANDGMVNGVVTWAVTVIALLGIALIGGGALVGSLADTATQFVNLRAAGAGVDITEATRTAQQTAGATALGLGLSMVAAALGGSIGAKLWPGHDGRDAHSR
jgi:cation transport ATPase